MPRPTPMPLIRPAATKVLRLPAVLRGVFAVYAEAHVEMGAPVAIGGSPRARLQRFRLRARFLGDLVAALPHGLRWLGSGDPLARSRVRQALGLGRLRQAPMIRAEQLAPAARGDRWTPGITLILPVFNARGLLAQCLDRIAAHTDLDWHLIVVEDASTDATLRPWLRDRLALMGARATLIEHASNQGFVASANRGLAAALARPGPGDGRGPCILINSDALVPPGWASRLVAPLQDALVASVTPLSNAAALMSVPVMGGEATADLPVLAAVDAALSGLDPAGAVAEMPTGVGFCMALSRDWLERAPGFDTRFGRGYGEEVDWCQRTRAMGGRHLLSGAVMVAHMGGESFGAAEKVQRIAESAAILSRRYPDFDTRVQRALADDPAVALRLAAGLAQTGADTPVPVYLAHALGGGAEHWLRDQIAGQPYAVVLRLGGQSRCQIEFSTPWGVTCGRTDDLDLVSRLLEFTPRRRLILSSLVGDADPAGILDWLVVRAGQGDRLEAVIHDHYPISPSFTLLDGSGAYRGLPDTASTDPAHLFRRHDGRVMGLAEWQGAWGRFLSGCDHVTCFSEDGRDKMVAAHPQVAGLIRVVPHLVPPFPPQPAPAQPAIARGRGEIVLGVPGNILAHKGAAVVAALARSGAPGLRLVVCGTLDPLAGRMAGVTVTGRYDRADLADLARLRGITHWLVPSVWPETFSFTTHETLATGLPVLALDLGAQGAAVRSAPNGIAVPHVPGGDHAAAILAALGFGPA